MSARLREARAANLTRWATSRTPARVWARRDPMGRSESRWRHFMSDEAGKVFTTEFYAALMDPDVDGAALLAGAEEALQMSYQDADPQVLRERLRYLEEEWEHECQARQDRALHTGVGVSEAVRVHMECLAEILALRAVLKMDGEDDR